MDFNSKEEISKVINILIVVSFSSIFLMVATGGEMIHGWLAGFAFLIFPNLMAWIFAHDGKNRVVTGIVASYFIYFLFTNNAKDTYSFSDIMFTINILVLIFLFIACVKYHTIQTHITEE